MNGKEGDFWEIESWRHGEGEKMMAFACFGK